MNGRVFLAIAAAVLFVGGLILMIGLTPAVAQSPTEPELTTEPVTVATTLPTELPTEATTEAPTEPPTDPPTEPAETTPPEELGLTASKAFAYDTGEDRMKYVGGDEHEKVAPASLTKLLTAYVALQYLQPEDVITAGDEVTWIDPNSSIAYIQPGHQLAAKMLLQGMIMQSGNDAAYTLAVGAGRMIAGVEDLDRKQAVGVFVDEMNRQARLLGMENSHFKNPDGIDEDGHYTTVRDLLTLSLAVLEQDEIMEFASMAKDDVEFYSGETCTWYNSNYLLQQESEFYTPEAMGLKTGSTEKAGKCLISLFKKADGYLIVGVLGSVEDEDRYKDTLLLYQEYK